MLMLVAVSAVATLPPRQAIGFLSQFSSVFAERRILYFEFKIVFIFWSYFCIVLGGSNHKGILDFVDADVALFRRWLI